MPPSRLSHITESFKAAARAETVSTRQAGRQREGSTGQRLGKMCGSHCLPRKSSVVTGKDLGQTGL